MELSNSVPMEYNKLQNKRAKSTSSRRSSGLNTFQKYLDTIQLGKLDDLPEHMLCHRSMLGQYARIYLSLLKVIKRTDKNHKRDTALQYLSNTYIVQKFSNNRNFTMTAHLTTWISDI